MSKSTKNTVKTLVPNAEGQLIDAEQAKAEGQTLPEGAEVKDEVAPKKTRKGGKRELNFDDPFMKQTIELCRIENPKRKGSKSAARFDLYQNGMTVATFIQKGGTRGDINWDVDHEHIKLIPAV